LQCVAVCCDGSFECVGLYCLHVIIGMVCCSVLQCVAVCCNVLQCVTTVFRVRSALLLSYVVIGMVCCSVLQCVAVCCSVLRCVATALSSA